MNDDASSLEERVAQLAAQLQALTARVEQLAARLETGAAPQFPSPPAVAETRPEEEEYPLGEPTDVSEEVLSWAGKTALLPRLATLCFLLVIALVLRTITDSGLIGTLAGSALGMGYAAVLILAGWYRYEKGSPLAPVFASCGAVLMCSIVVETHSRFASLPLVPAYLTLMATGIAMAAISLRYAAFLPVSLGTLGICLAGAAIDYPRPFFPYLALVLLTANVLAHVAARLRRCSWLRWIVLVVTVAAFHLWSFRLGLTLYRHEPLPPELALGWFLPAVALFASGYLAIALWGILRSGADRMARFDFLLPTITVVWAFGVALYVVAAGFGSTTLLGGMGIGVALGLLVLVFRLARREPRPGAGTNSFTFAGCVLLALALPAATGRTVLPLAVLSLAAIYLAIMARQWDNGGIRATASVVQIYACLVLAAVLRGSGAEARDMVNMLPAGILACSAIYHYRWCRRWPPPEGSRFFGRYDPHDRGAVLLLLGGLASGFFMLSSGIYQTLLLAIPEPANVFRCAQSVLVTGAAVVLMLYALRRRDREVRNVAIFVTLIAAIKVFLYDLLGAHGVPLVISVFSFGLAAAVESVALGRWQRSREAGGG
jgi:hypothetical protein